MTSAGQLSDQQMANLVESVITTAESALTDDELQRLAAVESELRIGEEVSFTVDKGLSLLLGVRDGDELHHIAERDAPARGRIRGGIDGQEVDDE